jgi:hypothetical protein
MIDVGQKPFVLTISKIWHKELKRRKQWQKNEKEKGTNEGKQCPLQKQRTNAKDKNT